MRYLVSIFFVLILNSINTLGQNSIGKIIQYTVWDKDAIRDKLTKGQLIYNDHQSLFVYKKLGLQDSIVEKIMTMNAKGMSIYSSSFDEKGEQIHRNFDTKTIIQRITSGTKLILPFTFQDNWQNIKWVITKKYKKIDTFSCQKAEGNFRGRKYTVWFTQQLPLPYGPWKLFGLPGIILEAKDNSNKFGFTFDKLIKPLTDSTLLYKPEEAEQKTLKEYVYFMDNYMLFLEKSMQKNFPKGLKVRLMDPPTPASIKKTRQKRIEKTYEWEEKEKDGKYNLNINRLN